MSTIWDLLSRRLMQGYAGTGGGAASPRAVAVGFLAASEAVRSMLIGLRSLLWSFSKAQQAIRAVAAGGMAIIRATLPYAGGAPWHIPRSKARSSAPFAKKRAAQPPRRDAIPARVSLSLSAAASLAKASGAFSGAIFRPLPPFDSPYSPEAATPPLFGNLEGDQESLEGSAQEAASLPSTQPSKGTAPGTGSTPKNEVRTEKKRAPQHAASSGVALASVFLASAAALGMQAAAALSVRATTALYGGIPQMRPPGRQDASNGHSSESESGSRAHAMPKGAPETLGLADLAQERDAMVSEAPIAKLVGGTSPRARLPSAAGVEGIKARRPASGAAAKESLAKEIGPPEQAKSATPGEALEGVPSLMRSKPGAERYLQEGAMPAESPLFAPSVALGKMEIRKAAGVWNSALKAAYATIFAFSITSSASRLFVGSGGSRLLAPDRAIRRATAEEAAPAEPQSAGRFIDMAPQELWRARRALAIPNLAALAEEMKASTILPQLPMPLWRGEPTWTWAKNEVGGETEGELPVPMKLEEPRVYPISREVAVKVTVEGDEDLLELQRKISRILEEEMRRHYGEG